MLVGTSAAGIVNDLQATPIARGVPGVEIHAQLLEQILQGAFLVRPDWAMGAEILFTLLVGIGLKLALPRIRALPSAVLGGASIARSERHGSSSDTLGDPELIELDLVAVQGKSEAGHIYTLPPEQTTQEQFITQHTALLGAYRRQDWASALRLLDDGRLAAARFLAPVYDLYRRRIAQFQIEPPPANWNGVFTAEEK